MIENITMEAKQKTAEAIIRNNAHVPFAYDMLTHTQLEEGNLQEAADTKKKAIACSPLAVQEYEDMFELLYQALWAADRSGDTAALLRIRDELIALPDMLSAAEKKLSDLGKKLDYVPVFQLKAEETEYIAALKAASTK